MRTIGLLSTCIVMSCLQPAFAEDYTNEPATPRGYNSWERKAELRCTFPGQNIVTVAYRTGKTIVLIYVEMTVNGETVGRAYATLLGKLPLNDIEVYVKDKAGRWTVYRWPHVLDPIEGERDRMKIGPRLLQELGITKEQYRKCPAINLKQLFD